MLDKLLEQYKSGSITEAELLNKVELNQPAQVCRLTQAQVGIWALQKMYRETNAYNIPLCFDLSSTIDLALLQEACLNLLNQHAALSSTLTMIDGEPCLQSQVVNELHFTNEIAEDDESLIRIKNRPFNLDEEPLCKFYLITGSEQRKQLLIVLHHLIFDGGSVLPLVKSLMENYDCLFSGVDAHSRNDLAYLNFMQHEQALLESERYKENQEYWLDALAGAEFSFDLPTQTKRENVSQYIGAGKDYRFSEKQTQTLKRYAASRGVSTASLMYSALLLLLKTYAGKNDLVVGVIATMRNRGDYRDTIGHFSECLPLRSKIEDDSDIVQFIKDNQKLIVEGVNKTPFNLREILRESGVKIDKNNLSAIPVSFVYQNILSDRELDAVYDGSSGELRYIPVTGLEQLGEFELEFELLELSRSFRLNLKYNPELYSETFISGLLKHYSAILKSIVLGAQRVCDVSLLDHKEQQQLLQDWNASTVTPETKKTLHALFEDQVMQSPHATAVEYQGREITYVELNAQVNKLANELTAQSAAKDGVIGVCMSRSIEMIVAILAVLKSGAGYLPIDPDFPKDRKRYLLENSGATTLLVDDQSIQQFSSQGNLTLINVMQQNLASEEGASEDSVVFKSDADQDSLAYLIYTSGSTGNPKGVIIDHRNAVTFLSWARAFFGGPQIERVLASTTICFDLSVFEIFLPLITGNTVVLVDKIFDIKDWDASKRLTLVNTVPSAIKTLLEVDGIPSSVQTVCLAGEPLICEVVDDLYNKGIEKVYDLYGPTECTTYATVALRELNGPNTIGRAIDNTHCYVLDANQQPLPVGVPGELYLGGNCVARGYLGDKDLTDEKFIDNFITGNGKLYRTGDLVQWREDGTLKYLGRIGQQVKVRGYRIELGEIETHLRKIDAVREAVVLAQDTPSGKRLVAFIELLDSELDDKLQEVSVRQSLSSKIPEYMIPQTYHFLAEIPLTPNRKIDKKALIAYAEKGAVASIESPREHIRETITEIWCYALKKKSIDTQQGFFENGGDSLSAVIAADRLQKAFKVSFLPESLFEYATIDAIGQYIATHSNDHRGQAGSQNKGQLSGSKVSKVSPIRKKSGKVSHESTLLEEQRYQDAVAVIGLSFRLPNAQDCNVFWENLREGREAVRFLDADELLAQGIDNKLLNNPEFIAAVSGIANKEYFDSEFFNISPRDAKLMDPQHRLLLQESWKAVEDAGYLSDAIPNTAVITAASNSFYLYTGADYHAHSQVLQGAKDYLAWTVNQPGSIPTSISYHLGFSGPSYAVHSNCSSSLVALKNAITLIRSGEVQTALVGAATLFPIHQLGYLHQSGMNFSSDGHLKAFDQSADGLIAGEGVIALLLKQADAAIHDRDHIYGLIRGVEINNDGSDKAGYFAPGVTGQREVIRSVYQRNNIDPLSISYLEAHGTGTALGDPVEFRALKSAFDDDSQSGARCAVGTIKSNIGHLDTAAGLAGCLKILLSFHHQEIPPSINITEENERLALQDSRFYLVREREAWQQGVGPRRAALSSFGIGGTNGHAVFEEYIAAQKTETAVGNGKKILPVCAKSPAALRDYLEAILAYVDVMDSSAASLMNLCYTFQVARKEQPYRAAFIFSNCQQLADQIKLVLPVFDSNGQSNDLVEEVLLCLDRKVEPINKVIEITHSTLLNEAAEQWMGGAKLDWRNYYKDVPIFKESVPTYPFLGEKYPLRNRALETNVDVRENSRQSSSDTHPLLSENKSSFYQQLFRTRISDNDAIVSGHRVSGRAVLPGVAYLEIASAALQASLPSDVAQDAAIYMRKIVWKEPLVVDEACDIFTELKHESDNTLTFSTYSLRAGDRKIHCQGCLGYEVPITPDALNTVSESKRLAPVEATPDAFYQNLELRGMHYGPQFQNLVDIRTSEDTILAKLLENAESTHSANKNQYTLNPFILDAALQTTLWQTNSAEPFLPFAIDELLVLKPLTSQAIVKTAVLSNGTNGSVRRYDITVYDSMGEPLVVLKGFACKTISAPKSADTSTSTMKVASEHATADTDILPHLAPETGFVTSDSVEQTRQYIKRVLMEVSGLESAKIDMHTSFDAYGIDSVLAVDVTEKLEEKFGVLPRTLFFEYSTLAELADHLNEKGTSMLSTPEIAPSSIGDTTSETVSPVNPVLQGNINVPKENGYGRKPVPAIQNGEPAHEIAIIGIAGRYPGARDLDEFWQVLKDGKDCITEIPADRWNHDVYYQAQRAPGKTVSKWGGFIEGVAEFDPLFFNISPGEAAFMDPQERLFLQCAVECIGDAGYTRHTIEPRKIVEQRGMHHGVGVFVGVMYEEYQLYGAQQQAIGNPIALGGIPASVANRVSYFCNFHGPSLAVDTMCSSSLTTIHLACESLRQEECSVALAGGVNVSVHPNKYLWMSLGNFDSPNGRCKSFGENSEGYVPGEGVGALLLKRKHQAINDGDTIYGIVTGSAVNHGGKTNSYTVPNPVAQADVVSRALQMAGTDPEHVSYVEAHGTGTSLGDPIEIAGLARAFKGKGTHTCAIGSIKSNIGHCESAAGIAGITKVLLQLKYKTLVASLHSHELNPHIDFANTPFKVQQQASQWQRITVGGVDLPRIAGVSSFGAGGSNAHIVLQEYEPAIGTQQPAIKIKESLSDVPAIVVLSARDEERLQALAERLQRTLEKPEANEWQLHDIAFTLQTGREAFEARFACLANSVTELREQLALLSAGETAKGHAFYGRVSDTKEALSAFLHDEDTEALMLSWLTKGKLEKLLDVWVKGADFDWQHLYSSATDGDDPSLNAVKKINLPVYDFSKDTYWVPELPRATTPRHDFSKSMIHPLIHENLSDLYTLKFASSFSGREMFLNDHRVKRVPVMPGVAYLEAARKAADLIWGEVTTNDHSATVIKDVVWLQPLVVKNALPLDIVIELLPDNDALRFEIYNKASPEQIACQGTVLTATRSLVQRLDLNSLRSQLSRRTLQHEECYQNLEQAGFYYGSSHRAIETLYLGDRQVLGKLCLADSVRRSLEDYVLHPGLLDSALQATIGMVLDDAALAGEIGVPFGIDHIEVHQPCSADMWVWIRESQERNYKVESALHKFDIDLVTEHGELCVGIRGYSSRVSNPGDSSHRKTETWASPETFNGAVTLVKQPSWVHAALQAAVEVDHVAVTSVFCGWSEEPNQTLLGLNHDNNNEVLYLSIDESDLAQCYADAAQTLFGHVKSLLKRISQPHLVQLIVPDDKQMSNIADLATGLAGILKTAHQENPLLRWQVLYLSQDDTLEKMLEQVKRERQQSDKVVIAYRNGSRLRLDWEYQWGAEQATINKAANSEAITPIWNNRAVYLITGGLGGLGKIFATEIAANTQQPVIILCGRRALDNAGVEFIETLKAQGAVAQYHAVDLCDLVSVTALIAHIVQSYGELNGVIHSAGFIQDNFIINKSPDEFAATLEPKVAGTVNLDRACANLKLDYFILFSSLSGVMGSPGQADYATANGFLDGFAVWRNAQVVAGHRFGRTLAVAWPYWKNGGMRISPEQEQRMEAATGLLPLETNSGLVALYEAVKSPIDRCVVISGYADKMELGVTSDSRTPENSAQVKPAAAAPIAATIESAEHDITAQAQLYIRHIVADTLRIPAAELSSKKPLQEYGVDSVVSQKVIGELEQIFGPLPKTLLFEYVDLQSLGGFFAEHHAAIISAKNVETPTQSNLEQKSSELKRNTASTQRTPRTLLTRRPLAMSSEQPPARQVSDSDAIAIVGLAGRYPGAANIEQFWQNLAEGIDSIREIPQARWDAAQPLLDQQGKPVELCRWGGFIDGVDEFDAEFFNIYPAEAEYIDPQERLFVQCAYEVLEDAGYTPASLAACSMPRSKVGVFVGVMYQEYQLFGAQHQFVGNPIALSGVSSSIANRVSYLFDFNGPSLALDTMCSSSLTAVHLACDSLRKGETHAVIAGGVNVSIHPNKYLALRQGHFDASEGRCKSFGVGGDGYVPGEGVGALLLKRCEDAERDGDHIYGLIKGSSINHGGKSQGYSAPKPQAQAEVIMDALHQAGIAPSRVSYIEAHGTGTSLGDPIEIQGMAQAFATESQHCAIGSVKSNIGHCESAAGVAGITKVLLQFKYRKLVPSLHSDTLNPLIDFENLPFHVQQTVEDWLPVETGQGPTARIAGVSSFGAGGANAHVVLEEYTATTQRVLDQNPFSERFPAIVVLSAKTPKALRARVVALLHHLQSQTPALADIAYTLQIGREAMPYRCGWLVTNVSELKQALSQFITNEDEEPDSNIKRHDASELLEGEASLQEMSRAVLENTYPELLQRWIAGQSFDWNELYNIDAYRTQFTNAPRRISLPVYSFEGKRHWIGSPVAIAVDNLSPANDHAQQMPVAPLQQVEPLETAFQIARELLLSVMSRVLKIPAETILTEVSFQQQGIDSIKGLNITAELERFFGKLSKTLFYEYKNVVELAHYFAQSHGDALLGGLSVVGKSIDTQNSSRHSVFNVSESAESSVADQPESRDSDIAIVGLQGRYPQSKNLQEFWENLKAGRDCVTTIPLERWDADAFYSDERTVNKTVNKWGGFVAGIDEFDALFFNISPGEADYIDPQERLFLQCAAATFEDAGYTTEQLRTLSRVGVYVGVMYNEYPLFGVEARAKNTPLVVGSVASSIANRVSWHFDLAGPSIALDTMCSSSLTALHLACESLRHGETTLALAGGVNLSLHPNKYLALAQSYLDSSTGQCRSFGEGGDGYVPGEGVGAVLLRLKTEAEKNGDIIYGIIRGSSVNHGGKTNGYTVPNSKAQANAISAALSQAKVDPLHVSYIEAHGTGTALGDPIEINGLSKVFGLEAASHKCALGSVKSNIGHCESAAGIAGLTKVLLQFKHGQLVPSLHSQPLNPHIDFENCVFEVQQTTSPWQRPWINGEAINRIAGVSAFGAGGSNAHVVVEEYVASSQHQTVEHLQLESVIIVLSAQDEDALQRKCSDLLNYIEVESPQDTLLPNIAYTLQLGRDPMPARIGWVVSSVTELRACLTKAVANHDSFASPVSDDMLSSELAQRLASWLSHDNVDWATLYHSKKLRKVSLPSYPFAKERHWLPVINSQASQQPLTPNVLHGLVHHVATLSEGGAMESADERVFESVFQGDEWFFRDHKINGESLLPGVAYLEMASYAFASAIGEPDPATREIRLHNCVWIRPMVITGETQVVIRLHNREAETMLFSVSSRVGEQGEEIIHAEGAVSAVEARPHNETLDIAALQKGSHSRVAGDTLYRAFKDGGFDYGPSHQALSELFLCEDEALAKLRLPKTLATTLDDYRLHPALLDGALQATVALLNGDNQDSSSREQMLPFGIEGLEIFRACSATMWVHLRTSNAKSLSHDFFKLDIDLYDDLGRLCVRILAYTARRINATSPPAPQEGELAQQDAMILAPHWRHEPLEESSSSAFESCELMVFGWQEQQFQNLKDQSSYSNVRHFYSSASSTDATPGVYAKINSRTLANKYMAWVKEVYSSVTPRLKSSNTPKHLVQLLVESDSEHFLISEFALGLSGFLKTVQQENSSVQWQIICLPRNTEFSNVTGLLLKERTHGDSYCVRYRSGNREVADWSELTKSKSYDNEPLVWRDGAAYLITGGLGGLGKIFAREIAAQTQRPVIGLVGRSPLDANDKTFIEQLRESGAQVHHLQADINNLDQVTESVNTFVAKAGSISGVLHCAGVLQDKLLVDKSWQEFATTLAPKVLGLANLDTACRGQKLDFFALFSSISAAFGNPGQADYAAGNGFMDLFCRWRNIQTKSGACFGRTVSVNWPLWRSEGMNMSAEQEAQMHKTTGMKAMDPEVGLTIFKRIIASPSEQVMVLPASVKSFKQSAADDLALPVLEKIRTIHTDDTHQAVVIYLRSVFTELLKIPSQKLQDDIAFMNYGIDSRLSMHIAERIARDFALPSLPKTLLFEYSNIETLANYLNTHHYNEISQQLDLADSERTKERGFNIANYLRDVVCDVLKVPTERLQLDDSLNRFGMDSIRAAAVTARITKDLGEISKTAVLEADNIAALAKYLEAQMGHQWHTQKLKKQAVQPLSSDDEVRNALVASIERLQSGEIDVNELENLVTAGIKK